MLEVLSNAVNSILSFDPNELDDASLHAFVVESQQRIDQLNAANARALLVWDERKIWASNGSKAGAARFARETGVAPSDAKRLLTRAKKLKTMPLTLDAFLNGELSCSQVEVLARVNQTNVAAEFARDEKLLVDSVQTLRFADGVKAVKYWQQMADETGTEDKAKKLLEQRSASVASTFEGSVDVHALFDPVNGAIFNNELQRIEQQLFEEDWAEARDRVGENAAVADLQRTASQRRADALIQMATRSASLPEGTPLNRPLLTVVLDRPGFERTCELASGTVLTPGQVVPLLSTAQFERIVFDGPARVIEVSQRRLFTGALRRTLEIRDRHCQHPSGCDVPAEQCQGDHINAWSNDGITNQQNGQLLCAFHNRAKGSGPPQRLTG